MTLEQINRFEKLNVNIAVNVLGYENEVYPLRISKHKRPYNVILLLLEKGGIKHYCLVKNLSRLLSNQVSNHNGFKEFCLRCMNHFSNETQLQKHEEYCSNNEINNN